MALTQGYTHSLTSSIYQSTSHFTLALHTIKSLRNSILSLYTDPFKQAARGPHSTGPWHGRPFNGCARTARISAYNRLVASHLGECQLPFACTGILDPGSRMPAPSETSLTCRFRRRARAPANHQSVVLQPPENMRSKRQHAEAPRAAASSGSCARAHPLSSGHRPVLNINLQIRYGI